MKSIKFIMAAALAVIISLGSTSVFAQEDGNRDANGYVVRGPYLTNGGGANWFVGVGGGLTTTWAKGVEPFYNFAPAKKLTGDVFIGKWFTPAIGLRVGYKGGFTGFNFDTEQYYSNNFYGSGDRLNFGYAHGDVMWNLSDALSGYKETRFWDIIPYATAGYLGINNGVTDNKLAAGLGVYNKFRLGKVVDVFLDVSILGTENPVALHYQDGMAPVVTNETPVYARPLYIPTASLGVAFNISHKKNFDRFKSVGVYKADYDKLYNENGELRERVGNLEQQNDELKRNLTAANNRPAEVKEVVVEKTRVLVGSNIITFPIGSCVLSETERAKVEQFAKNLDEDTLVQVLGSADSKTGTQNRNYALAKNRANVVKNELVKNGVAEDRISVDSTLDATDNVNTSRSAVVTLSVR